MTLRKTGLDADIAHQILSAALKHAKGLDTLVKITLLDGSGNLLAYISMPGSFLASEHYAMCKAWTAVSFGMSTRDFGKLLDEQEPHTREGLTKHKKVCAIPGGYPIWIDGRLAGAIGVSGGTAEQDEEIAQAAIFGLA